MITIYNENDVLVKQVAEYEFTEGDMGESSVSASVEFKNGQEFHPEWYAEYNGERFYLGVRKPTGKKDTSSMSTVYTLVFKSERENLKRYTFADFIELGTGNPQPASTTVRLYATLTEFVSRFNANLSYYLGTRWKMTLPSGYVESGNAVFAEFINASLWDVLIQIYTLYQVRWVIRPGADVMTIAVAEDAVEIEHIFEYGKNNGLVSVERNNALERIITRLRGKGSTKNLPPDYFHEGDPDTNDILKTVYYSNLMPSVYRDYVKGYNAGTGTGSWAYNQGVADKVAGKPIAPVDYVKSADEDEWGESYGAIEDNEKIFPTLQGIVKDGLGRVDEVVAVEEVLSDAPFDVSGGKIKVDSLYGNVQGRDGYLRGSNTVRPYQGIDTCRGEDAITKKFSSDIEIAKPYNHVTLKASVNSTYYAFGETKPGIDIYGIFSTVIKLSLVKYVGDTPTVIATKTLDYRAQEDTLEVVAERLDVGTYKMEVELTVSSFTTRPESFDTITFDFAANADAYEFDSERDMQGFKPTFDIWIKDVWGISRNSGENDEDYTYRVWSPHP